MNEDGQKFDPPGKTKLLSMSGDGKYIAYACKQISVLLMLHPTQMAW